MEELTTVVGATWLEEIPTADVEAAGVGAKVVREIPTSVVGPEAPGVVGDLGIGLLRGVGIRCPVVASAGAGMWVGVVEAGV